MAAMVGDWVRQARAFLVEVPGEAKRVTWLNFKQTSAQTAVALVFIFIIAVYLGLVDLGLTRFINFVLKAGV